MEVSVAAGGIETIPVVFPSGTLHVSVDREQVTSNLVDPASADLLVLARALKRWSPGGT